MEYTKTNNVICPHCKGNNVVITDASEEMVKHRCLDCEGRFTKKYTEILPAPKQGVGEIIWELTKGTFTAIVVLSYGIALGVMPFVVIYAVLYK